MSLPHLATGVAASPIVSKLEDAAKCGKPVSMYGGALPPHLGLIRGGARGSSSPKRPLFVAIEYFGARRGAIAVVCLSADAMYCEEASEMPGRARGSQQGPMGA